MKFVRTGHIAFHCRDVEESIKFYRDVFDCDVKFSITFPELLESIVKRNPGIDIDSVPMLKEFKEKGNKTWLTYIEFKDGFMFELFDSVSSEMTPDLSKQTGYQHFAMVVEDIQETYKELIAKNINVENEPRLGPDNTWQIWVVDPDGNRFEIMEYTDQSYQVRGNNKE